MKNFAKTLITYINRVHSYPFWLFIFFLYASIITFGASAIFAWFPIQTSVSTANLTTSVLFEGAVGLLAIGFITAPVMDIILHVDMDEK